MDTLSPQHVPYIAHVPYGDGDTSRSTIEDSLNKEIMRLSHGDEHQEHVIARYIKSYPVVYVVHGDAMNPQGFRRSYVVYVGESSDVVRRTVEHLREDPKTRADWRRLIEQSSIQPDKVSQYIIGDGYFNKSLTLDIENRLMQYMSSCERVKRINNRRGNPQGEYYTSDMFDAVFHDIWADLHREDPDLFPAEELIRDSALFKASPFHSMSLEQREAEDQILDVLDQVTETDSAYPTLILVEGAAGTGKTVLLSNLFRQILAETGNDVVESRSAGKTEDNAEDSADKKDDPANGSRAFLLVNHNEQLHVYNQIATKLGLQTNDNTVVMKPSTFIKRFSQSDSENRSKKHTYRDADGKKHYVPAENKVDIVLVDEAHLLSTQGNQGYTGTNMLVDILRRAKVVVAVFDPDQILRSSQRWYKDDLDKLFDGDHDAESDRGHTITLEDTTLNLRRIKLKHQFRVAADQDTIKWIDDFVHNGQIGAIPVDKGELDPKSDPDDPHKHWIREPYNIRIFDSPIALKEAIDIKAQERAGGVNGKGLSRVVATYDWPYVGQRSNDDETDGRWHVRIYRSRGQWLMGKPSEHDVVDVDKNTGQPLIFDYLWNYQIKDTKSEKQIGKIADLAWAEKDHTINEIGSTYTIQGFDLNYVGVIIGPSVTYDKDQGIVFKPEHSESTNATNHRSDMKAESSELIISNLRNELNVLMTRGIHGLYIFAVDPALRAELLRRQEEHDHRELGEHKATQEPFEQQSLSEML